MSGHNSDQRYILNVPLTGEIVQSTQDPACLSDLSERDKVWDEHQINVDKVSNYYKNTEFDAYAKKMYFCSELLDFKLTPDVDEGLLQMREGWIKPVEVTHGNAHPHFHCLIMVPAGYFGAGYLSQKRQAELWQECGQ